MSNSSSQLPTDLMEALMRDPIKRGLILQFLNQEKDNIEKYKRQELKKTPLKKLKKPHCESPTALQRRRALEQKDTTSEGSSSDVSEIASDQKGPELPFEELLKGVVAYVEVKRDNKDRSEGIKAVMKLMGAAVKDKFTNDVTHVIFKDGSFTTFEKAKLMKVHLVSVLWLDAVRRNNARVPEKNYPAFGNRVCDANVSILCSQIQKDYEDVIKDERRRRHTMMTPKTSFSSYLTAQNINLSDDESTRKESKSPELTSDDSDCGVIDGHTQKKSKNTDLLLSSSQITNDTSKNSSSSTSLLSRVTVRNKRKTINVISNMELTPNRSALPRTASSEKIAHSTPEEAKKLVEVEKKVLGDSLQSSTMSSLRVSTDTDKTKSGLGGGFSGKSGGSMGEGKENCSRTTVNTTMSSLRLSESPTKKSEEKRKRSRSTSKTTPASDDIIPKTPSLESNQSTSKSTRKGKSVSKMASVSTEKVDSSTDTKDNAKASARRNRRTTQHKDTSKRSSATDLVLSESEDEASKKEESPLKPIEKCPNITNSKKTRRNILMDSESDFEDRDQPKKNEKEKRERRATSVMPPPEPKSLSPRKSARRNRRTTSITSTSSDDNVTKRRRNSVARAIFESEPDENPNEKKEAKNDRKGKRASSVAPSKPNEKPTQTRRSTSAQQTSSVSIVLTRVDEATAKKAATPGPATPSPAKKSRVEEASTSSPKKTRKLYVQGDITGCSPSQGDEERKEHLKQKSQKGAEDAFLNPSQKSPENVFLNPNTIPSLFPKQKTKTSTSDLSNWSSDESEAKPVKQKTKAKKKDKTPPKRDSSADEQRELLELLERATSTQTRRSDRLSLSQTQRKYTFTSESDSASTSSLPITPMKRRSTLDFMSLTQSQQKRRLKMDPKRTESIVCTKMHRHEVVNFEKTVTRLGRFFVEDKVTGKTTHLVAGEAKRTINMLRAIARGCWILKHEWLLKSLEAGKWLNEEDYELTEFSPAVQQCRLQREAFGALYSMDIFKDCGYIYVGKSTTPKPSDLKELIAICKGRVTTIYRNAAVIVGEFLVKEGATCVTEMWVLDSIHFNKLKSFKNYLIKPASQGDSPHF